jgi:hypothetical protein
VILSVVCAFLDTVILKALLRYGVPVFDNEGWENKLTLITIVHKQKDDYIPMIYEFKEQIEQHVLCYDENDSVVADEMQLSIEKLNHKYSLSSKIKMIKIDEDSKNDLQNTTRLFKENNKTNYLNGAGADTALFIVLSSSILQNNGQVIAYDKEDNSYNLISKNGFLNKHIENNMHLEDFLILMGEELIGECSKETTLQHKEELELIFGDTKRMFKVRFLLKNRKTKELKKRYSKIMEALKTLDIVDENDQIKGQEGFVHFGILFEKFVYLQLKAFEFDDIKVGAKIRFDKDQVAQRNIEVTNEFDILTINENKIGFIECKIGDSSDPLSTIYKSDSIMEYFGQNASSMIVNIERDKTPHLKNSKKNFGVSLLYRAETNKVTIYNSFDFSKPAFRVKVTKAFDVDLKESFKKENTKEQMTQLQDKFGGK